jgi:hypothetical protein
LNVGEASFGVDVSRHITKLLQNLVNGSCNPKPPKKIVKLGNNLFMENFLICYFFSKKHYSIKDVFLLKSLTFFV